MSRKPTVAVILSGCGVQDGSEIHEAVLTLLAIDRAGATAACFAPDVAQADVINHLTGEPATGESRNALVEAARIARGAITDLKDFDAATVDALVLPGGFGAAKTLSSFLAEGPGMTVNADVARAVQDVHAAGKPIGALCIAPVILAKLLAPARVTIGSHEQVADAIGAMGATHAVTTHGEVVVDADRRIATTPCYMLDATVSQIDDGARAVVAAVLDMVRDPARAA